MFQFRFVVPEGTHVPPPIPRLQWRTRLVGVPGNSAYVINAWSDWVDVPTVALSDKEGGAQ